MDKYGRNSQKIRLLTDKEVEEELYTCLAKEILNF
jgi:hypothetical protein